MRRRVACYVLFIFFLFSAPFVSLGQDLEVRFYLDSLISASYPNEKQEVIDSIRIHYFLNQSNFDDALCLKTLKDICGSRFYRKNGNQMALDIHQRMDKELHFKEGKLANIFNNSRINMDTISLEEEVWNMSRLKFIPSLSDGQKHLNKIDAISNRIWIDGRDTFPFNHSIELLGYDYLGNFFYSEFTGNERLEIFYHWFNYQLSIGQPHVVKKQLHYFERTLKEDLTMNDLQMAKWYLALSKFYNSDDFYTNIEKSIIALARADLYLKGTKHFNKKLAIMAIRSDMVSYVPSNFPKILARGLFGGFYKQHSKVMTYEQKMKTLTLLCKHWLEYVELRRIDGWNEHIPINLTVYSYLTAKYFWDDEGYYGQQVRSNLMSLYNLNGYQSKMIEAAFSCLSDYPIDLNINTSIKAAFSLIVGHIKLEKFQFFNELIEYKQFGYDIIQLMIQTGIGSQKEMKELLEEIKRYPHMYGEDIYRMQYALRGSNLIESVFTPMIREDLNYFIVRLSENHKIDTNYFDNLIQNFIKEPSAEYYLNNSNRYVAWDKSWRYSSQKKWKKAYRWANIALGSQSSVNADIIYKLGHSVGWSSIEDKNRKLRINQKELTSQNEDLITITKEKEAFIQNQNYRINNQGLEIKKLAKELLFKQLKLAQLDDSIAAKQRELEAKQYTIGKLDSLNIELKKETKRAEDEKIKAKKAEALAKKERDTANRYMWAAIATSILFVIAMVVAIIKAMAFRKQKKRAIISEKQAVEQRNLAEQSEKRAIASERRERLTSFTVHQICHLSPDVVNDVKSVLPLSSKEYQVLDVLEEFLRKFYDQFNIDNILKDKGQIPTISLEDEVNMSMQYIALAHNRKSDDEDLFGYADSLLKFNYDVFRNLKVPPYCFLNAVANAINHGDYSTNNAHINVFLTEEDNWCILTIQNPPQKKEKGKGSGINFISDALREWNGNNEKKYIEDGLISNTKYQTQLKFKHKGFLEYV